MKKDQGGPKTIDRHIFVNSKDPRGCMMFWLGVRILSVISAATCQYIVGDECQASNGKEGAFCEWIINCLSQVSPEDMVITLVRRFLISLVTRFVSLK